MNENLTVGASPLRVRVFIDFWNFQLTLNEVAGKQVNLDWKQVGSWLAEKACASTELRSHVYEGCIVYTSYDPDTPAGRKYRAWVTGWLDLQAGVSVRCRERRRRSPPKCPNCYEQIASCPHCGRDTRGTVEKGVDTLLATDMIRLAWEEAYDVAVLATLDADLIPAVEFLDLKARKVIQAGFPPKGRDLATTCWASFNVSPDYQQIER